VGEKGHNQTWERAGKRLPKGSPYPVSECESPAGAVAAPLRNINEMINRARTKSCRTAGWPFAVSFLPRGSRSVVDATGLVRVVNITPPAPSYPYRKYPSIPLLNECYVELVVGILDTE
jgi:hypothetical protein